MITRGMVWAIQEATLEIFSIVRLVSYYVTISFLLIFQLSLIAIAIFVIYFLIDMHEIVMRGNFF